MNSRCGRCSPSMVSRIFTSGKSSRTRSCIVPISSRICCSTCWVCGCSASKSSVTSGRAACLHATSHPWSPLPSANPLHTLAVRRATGPGRPGLRVACSACPGLCLLFPRRKVIPPVPPPIPMPAWVLQTVYAGIELFLGVTGTPLGSRAFRPLGRHGGQRPGDSCNGAACEPPAEHRRTLLRFPPPPERLGYAPMKQNLKSTVYLAVWVCVCLAAPAQANLGATRHRRHHGHADHRRIMGGR